MISCLTARMSTCPESAQNLLILPRTLTLQAQPSQEAPNFVPVLPDVLYVPHVHVYPPSLNPAPKLSKKRQLNAISDEFPTDVVPTRSYRPD